MVGLAASSGTLWLCGAERRAVCWCHLCSADRVKPQAEVFSCLPLVPFCKASGLSCQACELLHLEEDRFAAPS